MIKRRMAAILVLGALALTLNNSPASAQQTTPAPAAAPCVGDQFHQLDFWLGDWDARWDAWPGQPAGHGRNRISRDFGGCVIHEHFDGGPSTGNLHGESWSLYQTQTHVWRQTWVDDQGGYFALTGGPEGDRFILVSKSITDNTPRQRMVFEDITPNSFTWRWQNTTDSGATWSDSWVIHYTRRGH